MTLVVAHKDVTPKVIQSKENGALETPVSSRGDILNLQFLRIALRKIAIWGLGGSLAVHLILGALSAIVVGQRAVVIIVNPPVEEEPEVTMVFPKAPAEAPYVRSVEQPPKDQQPKAQQPEEAPPAKRDFISDKSSVAISTDAPVPGGDPTLPTVKGTEALARDLLQSAFRDGTLMANNFPTLPSTMSHTPASPSPPSPPAPPQQVAKEEVSKVEPLQKMNAPVDSLSQTEQQAPELPAVSVQNLVKESPPAATPNTQASQSASSVAYEARTSQGGITRRGDQNALNAARTMAGEYYRDAQDSITRRWNKEMEIANVHMLPGTVVLRVLVDRNGNVRPSDITVISGRAGQILAQSAFKAILHTKLPPLPEEMAPVLAEDKFEFTMNFILH